MNIVICTPSQEEIDFFSAKFPKENIRFFKKNLDAEILADISDCEIFSGRIYSKVSREVFEKLPNLKFIVTHSTGFDHIDIDACNQGGVKILNVPSYGERSIAEFVFGLILSLTKNIHLADRQVQKMEFDTANLDGVDIFGRTIGIVGTGKIGKEVAKIAKGIGMEILAYDLFEDKEFAKEYGVRYVSLDELFANSDIVSLHVPNSESTHNLMDDKAFSKMKNRSYLINTARGAVVDTEALLRALASEKLRGVALDVLEYEKILFSKDEKDDAVRNAFSELEKYNVLYTPHMAAHSSEAQNKKLEIIAENIQNCLDGSPVNVVSPQ